MSHLSVPTSLSPLSLCWDNSPSSLGSQFSHHSSGKPFLTSLTRSDPYVSFLGHSAPLIYSVFFIVGILYLFDCLLIRPLAPLGSKFVWTQSLIPALRCLVHSQFSVHNNYLLKEWRIAVLSVVGCFSYCSLDMVGSWRHKMALMPVTMRMVCFSLLFFLMYWFIFFLFLSHREMSLFLTSCLLITFQALRKNTVMLSHRS